MTNPEQNIGKTATVVRTSNEFGKMWVGKSGVIVGCPANGEPTYNIKIEGRHVWAFATNVTVKEEAK